MHSRQKKGKVQVFTGIFLLVLYFSVHSSFSHLITSMYIPMLAAMDEGTQFSIAELVQKNWKRVYPLSAYLEKKILYTAVVEDESTYAKLLELEGTDEEREDANINMDDLDKVTKESTDEKKEIEGSQEASEENTDDLKEAMKHENETAINSTGKFEKALVKTTEFSRVELEDYQALVSQFYIIDSTTMIDESQLQIDTLLNKDMTLKATADAPQILIYHTHASEGFVDSIPGNYDTTVVGVGDKLAQILQEEYGYQVLHDKGVYDSVRAQAYNVAAPNIEHLLAENPSVEVVIDLHRDQTQEGTKLVYDLNGVPTARFMFFNGLSRTRETGDIDYLYNPYINENLAFAFQMQLACNEYYPGITRKIYLKGYRYNMHYRAKTLLIELGSQTNTVAEAMNACNPIAHALHMVLAGEVPDI